MSCYDQRSQVQRCGQNDNHASVHHYSVIRKRRANDEDVTLILLKFSTGDDIYLFRSEGFKECVSYIGVPEIKVVKIRKEQNDTESTNTENARQT
jgi:hypothetical protein